MKVTWFEDETRTGPSREELADAGVVLERLPGADQSEAALDALMRERGYIERDVIELNPETPDLTAILAKFSPEHLHTDDEVRFVLAGAGIFDIRSADDRWMRIEVEPGDLIVVPADRHHRFFLTDSKTIRCVRLFKDRGGWVPHYRTN